MAITTNGLKYYWNAKAGLVGGVLENLAPGGAVSNASMFNGAYYDSTNEIIHFDGTDDYLEVSNNSVFNSSLVFTYEYILETRSVYTSGYHVVIGDGGYMDFDYDSNGIYFQLMQNNSTRIPFTGLTTAIDTPQRLHIVVQFDQAAGIVRAYVNGTQVLNSTGNTQTMYFSRLLTDPIRFNSMLGESGFIPINFHSFRFYDRFLTPTEVADNYANGDEIGLAPPEPNEIPVISNLSPANNTVITSNNTTISATVTDVEGDSTTGYLELARDKEFANIVQTYTSNSAVSGSTISFNVTSLLQGNYYWRIRARNTSGVDYTEYTGIRGLFVDIQAVGKLYPDAILQQTGYTGTVDRIDESPDSPDANWMTTVTTPTSNTVLRVSFPTPSNNLVVGTGLQSFRVLVRKNKSTSTSGTMTIGLYENNVLRGTNSSFTVDASTNILTLTWDASLLASLSGSNVEVRMLGNGYTGNSGGNRFGIEIGAVEWVHAMEAELQDPVIDPSNPLGEVSGISGTSTHNSATITWTNPVHDDFSHVNIYRGALLVGENITTETFTESGLAAETEYTWTAKAVDTSFVETAGVSVTLITDTAPVDNNPPVVHSITTSRSKISDETGVNQSTLSFQFDKNVTEWTVNVLGSSWDTGTVADSGGIVSANTAIQAVIDWTELYQEGENRVNIYGKSESGIWTPYIGDGSLANVTNLTYTTTSSSVELSWSGVAEATSYEVLKDGVLLDEVTNIEYIAHDLTQDVEYTFTVKAKNSTDLSTGVSVAVTISSGGSPSEIIYAKDTFTRADSATTLGNDETGKTWTSYTVQTWGIQNNQAYPVAFDANDPIFIDAGVSTGIGYEVRLPTATVDSQIMWRITDKDNYFIYDNFTNDISRCDMDVWVTVATINPLVNGDLFRVELRDAEHKVFVNGSLVTTFNDTGHQSSTRFGFAAYGTGMTYDDFKVSSLDGSSGDAATNNESAQTWVGGIE